MFFFGLWLYQMPFLFFIAYLFIALSGFYARINSFIALSYRLSLTSCSWVLLLSRGSRLRRRLASPLKNRGSAEWLSPQTSGQRAFAEHSLSSGCSSSFFAVISSPPAFQIVLRRLDAAVASATCCIFPRSRRGCLLQRLPRARAICLRAPGFLLVFYGGGTYGYFFSVHLLQRWWIVHIVVSPPFRGIFTNRKGTFSL